MCGSRSSRAVTGAGAGAGILSYWDLEPLLAIIIWQWSIVTMQQGGADVFKLYPARDFTNIHCGLFLQRYCTDLWIHHVTVLRRYCYRVMLSWNTVIIKKKHPLCNSPVIRQLYPPIWQSLTLYWTKWLSITMLGRHG